MPNRQKVSVIPLGTEVLKASDLCSLEAAHNLRVNTFGFFRSQKGIDVAYHISHTTPFHRRGTPLGTAI
jgi:hypothetical protein